MPDVVEWSEFSKQDNSKSRDGIRNLRLLSGQSYKLRFVGNPLKFFKYFVANRSAICANPDTCPVRAGYNIEPATRYAINVLDRADGQLKILEVPPSVLKPVVAWWKATNNDPGSKNGCDFAIEVVGQKKNTRYNVTALNITPFTEEEKEYIKANIYDLSKIFKSTPENEIVDRLFGKQDDKPVAKTAATTVIPDAQPIGNKSASGVDLPF